MRLTSVETLSRMNLLSVSACTSAITRATTLPLRLTAPATIALSAIRTFPMPLAAIQGVSAGRAAARAMNSVRPTVLDQIGVASILIRKCLFPLGAGHHLDWLGLFAGHDGSPCHRKGE